MTDSKDTLVDRVYDAQRQLLGDLPGDLLPKAVRSQTDMRWVVLSDEEVIRRGLLLAKPNPSKEEKYLAGIYYGYSGLPTRTDFDSVMNERSLNLAKTNADFSENLTNNWNALEPKRTEFRLRLEQIRRGRLPEEFRLDLDLYRLDLVIVPKLSRQGDKMTLEHFYFPRTTEAAYGYVLDLLLDSSKPFGRRLARCAYETCGAFFMRQSTPSGGKPSKYCSPHCLANGRVIDATKRQQEYRKRQKTAKARRPK